MNTQLLAKTTEFETIVSSTAGKAAELREKTAALELAKEQVRWHLAEDGLGHVPMCPCRVFLEARP